MTTKMNKTRPLTDIQKDTLRDILVVFQEGWDALEEAGSLLDAADKKLQVFEYPEMDYRSWDTFVPGVNFSPGEYADYIHNATEALEKEMSRIEEQLAPVPRTKAEHAAYKKQRTLERQEQEALNERAVARHRQFAAHLDVSEYYDRATS